MDLHCARNFRPEIQHGEISDPQWITILAEDDGGLVGFAQLRRESTTIGIPVARPAELHRLYVVRERHGRGVAHDLMRAVIAAAAREGADCVWLGVWEGNPRAIAFYRKHGFRTAGEKAFTVGRDRQRDLVMVKPIENPSSSALARNLG
jgi:ribosomal protein S18 acetylase RimI-like enzyme